MPNQSEKLNREKKIANNKFSLILGTVNRLRPTTIYIDGRTFIMPLEAKTDYNEDLKAIKQSFKQSIRNALQTSEWFDKTDFILDFQVAQSGININKRSFLAFQCFLKQQNKDKILKINEIEDKAKPEIDTIVNSLEEAICTHNFNIYKTKKDA